MVQRMKCAQAATCSGACGNMLHYPSVELVASWGEIAFSTISCAILAFMAWLQKNLSEMLTILYSTRSRRFAHASDKTNGRGSVFFSSSSSIIVSKALVSSRSAVRVQFSQPNMVTINKFLRSLIKMAASSFPHSPEFRSLMPSSG